MKIGEVIRKYRKKENLTQEQVANYLNISTPAVNKWENGISYPDITILPPLARVLNIDINTLLAFNEVLTDKEINDFTKEVSERVSKHGYQKAFEKGSELIKRYLNCDKLVINISTVLRIHLIVSEIEEKDKYERKIISWFELVAESSKEKIASEAKLSLSAIYIERKEYEKAQELLDRIPEIDVNKKFQQALLFETSGKFDESYGIYEGMILKNSNEILSVLSLIIKQLCKENKYSEAEEFSERAKKLIEVFDLGTYNKYLLDLYLVIENQDKEKTIETIINMVNKASSMNDFMKSKLYTHMEFNNNHSISKNEYKRIVKMSIKKDKTLDFVKDDPRVKFLLE
ncbi:helix-turn-helix domain-containing protein [Clostridium weizhouense]|uniref:Helix-turn-helix domain-containing protein n=1 Tax=Clostridium weizhouense TaxID=2859781 RepID=A0ABS7AS34_9CLOT|nr:helix-turn-helix transcriptional regulator [Clostridium weizhouense]MBW6410878.1 helix-turn-helix domain-containing protein [Clostridium weizhouense]